MRIFIISLSILFFVLSGLIIYRALEIPDYDFSYKTKPEPPAAPVPVPEDQSQPEPSVAPATEPEVQSQPEPPAKEQDASRIEVEQLKAAISELEEKLADSQQETALKAETKEPEEREQVLVVLGGGSFLSGQVVVSSSLISSVNEVVQKISASPGHHVVIEGHTDNIPIKANIGKQYQDNMDLSFLRAKAISGILVEKGISRDLISVVGYGDSRPVASNDTPEGRARNRRVEVKLMPGKKEF